MSREFLRLAEKPGLNHPGYPICDACNVETDFEDGDWECPSCGTLWPGDDMEADPEKATLYQEWAGEELEGPICPNEYAWLASKIDDPDQRDKRILELTQEQP